MRQVPFIGVVVVPYGIESVAVALKFPLDSPDSQFCVWVLIVPIFYAISRV